MRDEFLYILADLTGQLKEMGLIQTLITQTVACE